MSLSETIRVNDALLKANERIKKLEEKLSLFERGFYYHPTYGNGRGAWFRHGDDDFVSWEKPE